MTLSRSRPDWNSGGFSFPMFPGPYGTYVPPLDFGKMMNQARSGLSLAYGLRASGDAALVELVGYGTLAACIVASAAEATVELLD